MVTLSPSDKVRLTTLRNKGIIKGYQEGGGPNYGVSAEPLPFIIFPINEGWARTFYSTEGLRQELSLLEEHGPFPHVDPSEECVTCGRHHG